LRIVRKGVAHPDLRDLAVILVLPVLPVWPCRPDPALVRLDLPVLPVLQDILHQPIPHMPDLPDHLVLGAPMDFPDLPVLLDLRAQLPQRLVLRPFSRSARRPL